LLSTKQIRGLVLEEIILVLLSKAGYRILKAQEDALIRDGKAGLEVQGRGEWHQVDALVAYDHTPAFLFPIRLGLEAKAYFPTESSSGKVGIEVIRNAVGVVKDLNENYFSDSAQTLKLKRYNYVYSIFSLNGFTKNAQRYAMAHQIYLVQYYHNQLFSGIRTKLGQLDGKAAMGSKQSDIRGMLKGFFTNPGKYRHELRNIFDQEIDLIENLLEEVNHIGGSYFGLLNGEYPIHIVSERPIDNNLDKDEYEVYINARTNGIVEINLNNNNLLFELPIVIAQLLENLWVDDKRIYDASDYKRRNISFITLSGIIGGVRRNLKLILNNEWLNEYLSTLEETTE
jgi:hypothetical protein